MPYDPAKHHRQSIRLKGHDYASGGTYFVTICAHREAGNIFADAAAKEVVQQCWQEIPAHFPQVELGEFVVMPDHVHGILSMAPVAAKNLSPDRAKNVSPIREKGSRPCGTSRTLGSVVRGFKVGVTKQLRPKGSEKKIWHRNYYEMIVRSAEAEEKIATYIRMNPWKCVQNLGSGLRGIGNPALWHAEKLGVLCSRNAPPVGAKDFSPIPLPEAAVYLGGWHSPKEKEILDWLLEKGKSIIACPAWGIGAGEVRAKYLSPLQENRLLILEMHNRDGDLAAAEQRNRFVIEQADALFTPHVTPGGMLDRLLKENK
ncbi:hypothetical protein P4E94_07545 [Pontiellaceae bacterium B12219]|nr:hypothetical protein [Pontiellaceae bacterium B12219]